MVNRSDCYVEGTVLERNAIKECGYNAYKIRVTKDVFDGKEFKGAVVTNVIAYPQKKVLCMQFCGGEQLKDWKDQMLALLRRFAKDVGCESIESTARRGWAKIFQNDGYKAHWVTFELPLDTEKEHG